MSFNLFKEIDKTNFVLDLIGAKQEATSTNIANVNTPGYVRKDVNFDQYLGILNKPLETELSKKMGACPLSPEESEKVNLGQELISMQKNALLYTIASRRATKIIQDMKSVTQLGR